MIRRLGDFGEGVLFGAFGEVWGEWLVYCGAGGAFGGGVGSGRWCRAAGAEGLLEVLFVELPFAGFEDGSVFVGATDPGAGGAVGLASFLE